MSHNSTSVKQLKTKSKQTIPSFLISIFNLMEREMQGLSLSFMWQVLWVMKKAFERDFPTEANRQT